jgi:hypothetical protein
MTVNKEFLDALAPYHMNPLPRNSEKAGDEKNKWTAKYLRTNEGLREVGELSQGSERVFYHAFIFVHL